jgi:hypothetical protein
MKPALAFVLCCALAAVALPAEAGGLVSVQQSNGSVQKYAQVRIRWTGWTLWLRSADHKGVLQITTGACSYAGLLLRCLPYSMTLHQDGTKRPIGIAHGTIYLNLSGGASALPYSSHTLASHALLGSIATQHGTFVTITGTLDEVH